MPPRRPNTSFLKRFYFLRERESEHKQGERQREREKQTPHRAGGPSRGLIPGPCDHDLSQTKNWMLNLLRPYVDIILFFFKILFIYLRESMSRGRREGEAGSPLSRKPGAGLDPRTPGIII